MVALAAASMSVATYAQTETVEVVEVPTEKYSVQTNKFWNNWFIQANGAFSAFYSSQEQGVGKSPFEEARREFGFSVAVGKWFTPGLGLRTKFNGIWGKSVLGEKVFGEESVDMDYWNIHEDVMFNLSNMLCGYNEKRVWNFIPYIGAGVARNCSGNRYGMTYNGGILNTFRLGSRWSVNLELAAMFAEADLDGIGENVRGFRGFDKAFTAEVGFTYNLGKTGFKNTPDVDAIMALNASQLDALNAALADQQAENAKLKSELAKKPKEVVKTETVYKASGAPQSVFFNIGSSKIASKKEIVNLEAIANVAKENNSKVTITGYADSATGSASYNQSLSVKRAEAVAKELEKLGVNRDQMIIEGKGGVATLKPASYNRRVIVEIK